jgi:uncharacterized membrane protein YeaQ/YmgE (transglycosylase-associated protein family)
MMLEVLSWVIFGFGVGILARAILPGKDSMGFFATTLLGIFGALVGGWLGRVSGLYPAGSSAGWITATLGALAVLALYNRAIKNKIARRKVSSSDEDKPRRAA